MALFKIFKGTEEDFLAKRTQATNGYCYFVEDTGKMYIDIGDGSIEENSGLRVCLNADEADKLKVARTISLTGDATGSASFDGAGDIEINVAIEKGNSGLGEPIILTNEISYGNILPTNPEEGQLFFLGEDSEELSSLPKGGNPGECVIKNDDGDIVWGKIVALPEGGSDGQYLVKTGTADGKAEWKDLPIASASTSGIVTADHQTFAGNKTFNGSIIAGGLTVSAQDTSHEGGEIILESAISGYKSGHIDIFDERLRVHDGANEWFYINLNDGTTTAHRLYGAVWNDYAEYRDQKEEIKPGYCVASANNGQVYKTTEKFQACDGIVSDTFGFAIGETDECKTPLAVSGRVLAYCEGDKYNYNAGDTVCAGPDGRVCKMTREEVREWPDRIIGIVSEIPEYDTWGTGNVKVDGRIWIKVK